MSNKTAQEKIAIIDAVIRGQQLESEKRAAELNNRLLEAGDKITALNGKNKELEDTCWMLIERKQQDDVFIAELMKSKPDIQILLDARASAAARQGAEAVLESIAPKARS